ncbi:hypothetical protein CVT26_010066 [Gymnopilus dilepis]|uniref:Uncharacterized protein n=1 Tax=Gymnopilus dilepis TaxID=231916 RepID=A0A409VWK0_9AGAR|nr:hypothetical protein CVT26_010066 [Gymnopilus dilepis]
MSLVGDVNGIQKEPNSAFGPSRHVRPQAPHRSPTASSRKPLRSSPLAGPAVVSLNDPPFDSPDSRSNGLSPPPSLHLRSKSKSTQTLARPVSLYADYSFDPSSTNSRLGHRRRPSTAPGPETDISTHRKRFSLASPASISDFGVRIPQRPSSVLVTLQEGDVQEAGIHLRLESCADNPERGSLAPSSSVINSNLRVPRSRLSLAESSSGARARYSYLSSSAGPSSRPVSFVIAEDSDFEGDSRQSWRTSYHSATPKPILKHPTSRSSFVAPSITSSASASSPSSAKSTSSGSTPWSPTSPVTSGPQNDIDNSWYTLSPYATTPKFSRLGLGAPGVVMPISAKEMARRKNASSRSASLKPGKQPVSANAGNGVSRRPSLVTRKSSQSAASTSGSTNENPDDKAQTADWLSYPPPTHDSHRRSTRVWNRTSLNNLRNKSHALSPSSSLARSAASSAASSSSSLRSSSCYGHHGRSSTSTSATTPLSSPPSSISLRSWKSLRASLSSLAAPVTPQALPEVASSMNLASSAENNVDQFSSQHSTCCSTNHQDSSAPVESVANATGADHDVGVVRPLTVKRDKSASSFLARIGSWRRRSKSRSRALRKEDKAEPVGSGDLGMDGWEVTQTHEVKGAEGASALTLEDVAMRLVEASAATEDGQPAEIPELLSPVEVNEDDADDEENGLEGYDSAKSDDNGGMSESDPTTPVDDNESQSPASMFSIQDLNPGVNVREDDDLVSRIAQGPNDMNNHGRDDPFSPERAKIFDRDTPFPVLRSKAGSNLEEGKFGSTRKLWDAFICGACAVKLD